MRYRGQTRFSFTNLRTQLDHLGIRLGECRQFLGQLTAQLRKLVLVTAVLRVILNDAQRRRGGGAFKRNLRFLLHPVRFRLD